MRAAVTTLRLLGIEEGSEGSGARADIRVLGRMPVRGRHCRPSHPLIVRCERKWATGIQYPHLQSRGSGGMDRNGEWTKLTN